MSTHRLKTIFCASRQPGPGWMLRGAPQMRPDQFQPQEWGQQWAAGGWHTWALQVVTHQPASKQHATLKPLRAIFSGIGGADCNVMVRQRRYPATRQRMWLCNDVSRLPCLHCGRGAEVVDGCRPIRPRRPTWPPPSLSSWWLSWPIRLPPSILSQESRLWKLGPRDPTLVTASHSTRFDCPLTIPVQLLLFIAFFHDHIFISIPAIIWDQGLYLYPHGCPCGGSLIRILTQCNRIPALLSPCLGSDRQQKCVSFDRDSNKPSHSTCIRAVSLKFLLLSKCHSIKVPKVAQKGQIQPDRRMLEWPQEQGLCYWLGRVAKVAAKEFRFTLDSFILDSQL